MKNVADIYRLTALQEGLLFHSVAEPGAGLYIDQVSAELTGTFDPARFQAAWDQALQRHAALRTAFLWDGLDEPVQVVRETVELPWTIEDWRADEGPARARRRDARRRLDRAHDFALEQAPLLRMTLARTGEQSWWWLWTFHHLVADGWSTAVLLREVFAAYATGQPESVGPGDVPAFRDYIAWQADQDLAAAERYWRHELRGFTEPTRLSQLPQESSVATPGTRQQDVQLSAETTNAIRTFAADHGLTLNTVVQGAWALLLGRLTLRDDIVFGVTTSGRPPELAGIERAVGLFINTLPLRAAIEPEAPLSAWLKDLQKRQLDARRFEFSPLASVQRWSEVPAGDALFESILVFENYPEGDALAPPDAGLEVGELRFDERSNYPLALLCLPGARLRLIAIHDPSRIGEKLARLCLRLLDRIMGQLAATPHARLKDIRLDDAEDRRQLQRWNDTATEPVTCSSIHEWIARTARDDGDRVAVVGPDRSLSYAELDARARALAAELRAKGVGRGDAVAIIAEPSAAMITGLLGILMAGAAYVPLDPAYPLSLMRHVLDDAGAAVVVSQAALLDRLQGTAAGIVTLDLDAPLASHAAGEVGAEPDDPAYILYTSGTTGRPKGVPISHRNLVHSTEARLRVYGDAPPRFLLQSSFTFDSSVAGIFWALAVGGTLVIPRRHQEQDMAGLLALIREHEVSHTLCLPTLYGLLLREAAPGDLASLGTVIVAGEACPASLVRAHHQSRPEARLFNEYGPTEATVWATVHELSPNDAQDPVPIGRPIPRMHAHVLDAERRPVPPGVPGELWLAGAGLSAGYRNLAALTDERFAVLDVTGTPERCYRTGDLAVWRDDGTLAFLGRVDSQLKLRGRRIEPSGIEAVLREQGDIADAAVTVQGTLGRLVAHVVPRAGATLDTAVLRGALQAQLADYLVPDQFVTLPSLPRTWSGKIDYRSLPEPAPAPVPTTSAAPTNAIEATLAAIWRDVLGAPTVGLDDDYAALGGDSLLSIQIVSRVRQELDAELPLGIVFQARTVRALALAIEAHDPERGWPCLVPIRGNGTRPPLYLMHSLEGEIGPYYNLANRLPLDQPVFGVQAPRERLGSIEDMAARYLDEIRARQPQGPYWLGGFCIGGFLAFEMGRRLAADGHEVAPLVLFDCLAPGPGFATSQTVLPSAATLTRMALADPHAFVDRVAKRVVRSARRLKRTSNAVEAPVELNEVRDLSALPPAYLEPSMRNFRAGRDYLPEPWDGDAILLRTEDERFGGDLGWSRFIQGRLEIIPIPGKHADTLEEPAVQETGRLLAAVMERMMPSGLPRESRPRRRA